MKSPLWPERTGWRLPAWDGAERVSHSTVVLHPTQMSVGIPADGSRSSRMFGSGPQAVTSSKMSAAPGDPARQPLRERLPGSCADTRCHSTDDLQDLLLPDLLLPDLLLPDLLLPDLLGR